MSKSVAELESEIVDLKKRYKQVHALLDTYGVRFTGIGKPGKTWEVETLPHQRNPIQLSILGDTLVPEGLEPEHTQFLKAEIQLGRAEVEKLISALSLALGQAYGNKD